LRSALHTQRKRVYDTNSGRIHGPHGEEKFPRRVCWHHRAVEQYAIEHEVVIYHEKSHWRWDSCTEWWSFASILATRLLDPLGNRCPSGDGPSGQGHSVSVH
jgi:hypothetical protein